MQIQSKFRDYYDNCAGYGIDKSVVYKRERKELNKERYLDDNKYDVIPYLIQEAVRVSNGWGPDIDEISCLDRRRGMTEESYAIGVLGFCGVIYKVCFQRVWVKGHFYPRAEIASHYSSESMSDTLKASSSLFSRGTLGELFSSPMSRENTDIFIKLNAPTFVAFKDHIVVNPCLKDRDFGKIKSGVEAFQEISSFISGTLNTANAMPMVTDDKSLAESKGFDKRSFRKDPTKRKSK